MPAKRKTKSKPRKAAQKRKPQRRRAKLARSTSRKCTGTCRIRTAGMGLGEVRTRTHGGRKYEILRVK